MNEIQLGIICIVVGIVIGIAGTAIKYNHSLGQLRAGLDSARVTNIRLQDTNNSTIEINQQLTISLTGRRDIINSAKGIIESYSYGFTESENTLERIKGAVRTLREVYEELGE